MDKIHVKATLVNSLVMETMEELGASLIKSSGISTELDGAETPKEALKAMLEAELLNNIQKMGVNNA